MIINKYDDGDLRIVLLFWIEFQVLQIILVSMRIIWSDWKKQLSLE